MKAAIYARVSTLDQEPENQLGELRRYVEARGWTAVEYVDRGVSGAKDRRPALDRLGRNLKHLVTLLEELQALGVAFVSLGEGIDCTTPAGRLQLHVLAALAEFERSRIAERVRAGLARVRASGRRLGRPRATLAADDIERTASLSVREAAGVLGVNPSLVHRHRLFRKPSNRDLAFAS